MKAITLALLFIAVSAVVAQDIGVHHDDRRGDFGLSSCHPMCKWQCDDPACPAVCHPVCARPQCEMKCEEVTCAQCTIHCERPVCTIRCPKDLCEKAGCPQCETVCQPARCHTTCVAPEPNCAPVCEELDCQNKCIKPVNCAKPKCELQCERPACEADDDYNQCCPCGVPAVAQFALNQATNACACALAHTSPCGCAGLYPSLIEVLHTMQHKEQTGAKEQCCPCAGKH